MAYGLRKWYGVGKERADLLVWGRETNRKPKNGDRKGTLDSPGVCWMHNSSLSCTPDEVDRVQGFGISAFDGDACL